MNNCKELLNKILFKYVNRVIEDLYFNTSIPISISMLYYMDKIYMSKKITPSALANEMRVSRPASTKMIKKLINLDYIEKNPSEVKGNTYTVSLTDKGLEIYNINNKINEEFINLLDKYFEFDNIKNLNAKLTNLLNEYNKL